MATGNDGRTGIASRRDVTVVDHVAADRSDARDRTFLNAERTACGRELVVNRDRAGARLGERVAHQI